MGIIRSSNGWTNEAAWSNGPKADLVVGPAEMHQPGPREILVKIEVVAIAPEDYRLQQSPPPKASYPAILGTSYGGRVVKAGTDAGNFAPGDRVSCCRPRSKTGDHRYGAFQRFALASIDDSIILDSRTEVQDGVATLVDASVAVASLSLGLGIERPPAYGKGAPKNEKVLVYGGSTTIGSFAVEYSSFAGYSVITTSSSEHCDYVSTLGARVVIDHTQSEAEIVARLKANGPYHYIFDCTGSQTATDALFTYLGEKGGKYAAATTAKLERPPIPSNAERVIGDWRFQLTDPRSRELAHWFFRDYLPRSLGSGAITPTRQINFEGDLDTVQQILREVGSNDVEGYKFILDLLN